MAQDFPDDMPSLPPHASPPIICVSDAPTVTPINAIGTQFPDSRYLAPHREVLALTLPNSEGVVISGAGSRPSAPPKQNLHTLLDPYDGKSPYATPVDDLLGLNKSPSQESFNALKPFRRDQIRQNDHLSTTRDGRSSTAFMIPDEDRPTLAWPAFKSVDNLLLKKNKNFFSSAKHRLLGLLTPSGKTQPKPAPTADHAYDGPLPVQYG
ncbi:hypothetical protein CPB84DRAFT_1785779, partial [Gymnopilus junonius]